jgi:hypothetical protein
MFCLPENYLANRIGGTRLGLLSVGISVFISACSLFGGSEDSVEGSNQDAEMIRLEKLADSLTVRMQNQVETLRNQNFIRPVVSAVLTRDQYRAMVAEDIDSSLSDSLSQEITLELAQWGYYPSTQSNYKDDYTDFAGGFAVGFYIGGTDSLFIMAEAMQKPEDYLGIIPHELVHALQDQYGRLTRPRIADTSLQFYGDDARWYHTTLIEGEAHFITALTAATYTYPQPDPMENALTVVRDYRTHALAAWQKVQRPNNLYLPSHSPYQFGPVLVGEAYVANGWDSVETLFAQAAQPSVSAITRGTHGFSPIDISTMVRVIDTTLGYHDVGSHGSLGLLSMVNTRLAETDFYQGLNWVGDAYAYAHHPGQKWGRLAWMGRFETTASASRAAELLVPLLRDRFKDQGYPETDISSANVTADLPGWHLTGSGLSTYLLRNENELYWVEGLKPDEIEIVLRDLKEQSKPPLVLARQGQRKVLNRFGVGKGRIYSRLFNHCGHAN